MTPIEERSAGEKEFINQRTRELMVEWCHTQVVHGSLAPTGLSEAHRQLNEASPLRIYFEYAKTKKWISSDGAKILSAGWDTAARFLKR